MILVAGLVFAGVFVGWIVGHYATPGHTKTVTVAAGGTSPSAAEASRRRRTSRPSDLAALPKDDWPTVGGNLMNERYSPLDQIDTSNVSQLKGVWRTHLDGSGVAAKYSAESQPVVYKGVIYVTTGEDDAFAVSVATGKILWTYTSGISQKITTVCCGWLNRGVAIGDGRVYLGQLDGKVVALDQQTGKVLWTKQLVKWQLGQTITAAPIYVDGKIYIGVVGAEYGTRSFIRLPPAVGQPSFGSADRSLAEKFGAFAILLEPGEVPPAETVTVFVWPGRCVVADTQPTKTPAKTRPATRIITSASAV